MAFIPLSSGAIGSAFVARLTCGLPFHSPAFPPPPSLLPPCSYLTTLKGVGPTYAAAIFRQFGTRVFDVLSSDDAIKELQKVWTVQRFVPSPGVCPSWNEH